MPLPTTKEELLLSLKNAYHKLDEEFDDISSKQSKLKGIEGNISACDVLAYQIGWGKLLLKWENEEQKGKKPHMPAKGFKWNELTPLAQSFYNTYSQKNQDQLRKELNKVIQKIVHLIKNLEHDELFLPHHRNWTGEKWAVVKWIQVNTIAPYKSARTKIRRWKKAML